MLELSCELKVQSHHKKAFMYKIHQRRLFFQSRVNHTNALWKTWFVYRTVCPNCKFFMRRLTIFLAVHKLVVMTVHCRYSTSSYKKAELACFSQALCCLSWMMTPIRIIMLLFEGLSRHYLFLSTYCKQTTYKWTLPIWVQMFTSVWQVELNKIRTDKVRRNSYLLTFSTSQVFTVSTKLRLTCQFLKLRRCLHKLH